MPLNKVLGPDVPENPLFFCFFLFLFSSFYWFLVPDAFIGYCFFCFCFPRFFGFWFRKLLSATRTTKNTKTSRKTPKKTDTSEQSPWPRRSWESFVFFCFCFPRFFGFWFRKLLSAIVFFVFVFLVFWVFGSGSFYRLLGPPKTQKPREKQKKTNASEQSPWPRRSWESFVFFCFFFCFCFHRFIGFWFRKLLSAIVFFVFVFLVFWVFGSGSFYRLLGPPKTQKPGEKQKGNQEKRKTCKTGGRTALLSVVFWRELSIFSLACM